MIEKMRLAPSMPDPQVKTMRANVVACYESHLEPEVVVRAIEACRERVVTRLLLAELNMAMNASKLNRHSVIIKGPDSHGPCGESEEALIDTFTTGPKYRPLLARVGR